MRFRAAVVLVLAGLVARPAAAAAGDVSWSAEPAANAFGSGRDSFRYTINPGGQLSDGVVVVNHGAAPLHLALQGTGGVAAWVRFERAGVTVPAGGSATVPFTVAPPKEAAPGDHAGAIGRVPVRLRVGGALKPSLAVEDVHVRDATVTYTIRNNGNAILSARQAVSVSGPFGRWPARAGRIADTPPLLPGAVRAVSVPVQDVTPALRLTATVTLIPLLTDAAGSTAPLAATKASGHAWAIPWTPIVVVCALLIAALAVRRRRVRIAHA